MDSQFNVLHLGRFFNLNKSTYLDARSSIFRLGDEDIFIDLQSRVNYDVVFIEVDYFNPLLDHFSKNPKDLLRHRLYCLYSFNDPENERIALRRMNPDNHGLLLKNEKNKFLDVMGFNDPLFFLSRSSISSALKIIKEFGECKFI